LNSSAEKEDKKEEEVEEDHKSNESDGEPDIDLANLPSDPAERLKLLGIDSSLFDPRD
jgi:hypothetical protein